MSPARAAWTGAAIGYGLIAVLGWTMWTDTTPDPQRIGDVVFLTALLDTPRRRRRHPRPPSRRRRSGERCRRADRRPGIGRLR